MKNNTENILLDFKQWFLYPFNPLNPKIKI